MLGIEGLICIAMAAPIVVPLSIIGASLAYAIRPSATATSTWSTMALLPLLILGEAGLQLTPPHYAVTSSVEIDAPPERVWDLVINFPPIPEPREWLFRAGIAYPISARIDGHGPGAVRYCQFNTGAFVEPIEVWDAPRHLAFRVSHVPPPMRELSPYSHLDPPHLHGFLVSTRGQFRLERLAHNRTRLEGTTWYRHSLWPAAYWRLFSDEIIHRIHLRVLLHVKQAAEARS